MRVTAIVIGCNDVENAEECVDRIVHDPFCDQLIFIDNGSTDSTLEWLQSQSFDYVCCDEGI